MVKDINIRIVIYVVLVFSISNLKAQKIKFKIPDSLNFESYASYMERDFKVKLSMPNGLIDLNGYNKAWKVRTNTSVGFLYGPILQTQNKDCIVMYPLLALYSDKEEKKRFQETMRKVDSVLGRQPINKTAPKYGFPLSAVVQEIKAAHEMDLDLYLYAEKETDSFDLLDYVDILTGKRVREFANADTVYLYELPLEDLEYDTLLPGPLPAVGPENFKSGNGVEYTSCWGLAVYKENHSLLLFKLFLGKDVKIDMDYCLSLLSNAIHYTDKPLFE